MKPLVVVIVGPTASGKTKLAIALAQRFQGEIVSADSMQIYRKMNIGTAKPTETERCGIPHHMMDFLEPDQEYTLKQYLEDANACVADILQRGKLPILVGGTGLYVTSFMNNLALDDEPADGAVRAALEEEFDLLGGEAMLERFRQIDPEAAGKLHPRDRKRILRGLEVFLNTGITPTEQNRKAMSAESPYRFLCIGLTAENRDFLYERINLRVDQMMEDGLLEEVRALRQSGCSRTARQAIGYRQFEAYFSGEATLEDVVEKIKKESRNYAKRQLTWFRRDPSIHWHCVDREEFDNILNFCVERMVKCI